MIGKTAKSASPMGLLINGQPSWNIGSWTISAENLILEDGDTKTLVFEGNLNGLIIRRELTFDAATYLISEKITYGAEEGKSFHRARGLYLGWFRIFRFFHLQPHAGCVGQRRQPMKPKAT